MTYTSFTPLEEKIRRRDQVRLNHDGSTHTVAHVYEDGTLLFDDFGTAQPKDVTVVVHARVACFLSRNTSNPYGELVADEDMCPPLPPKPQQGEMF